MDSPRELGVRACREGKDSATASRLDGAVGVIGEEASVGPKRRGEKGE